MKRIDVIKIISYAITCGKGMKFHVDGHDLRLQMYNGYHVWHDETDKNIAAVIHEEDQSHLDYRSEWSTNQILD